MTEESIFATATFSPMDVEDELNISNKEARKFLCQNRKYIEEAMVRAGFDAIHTLSVPLGTEG